LKIAIYSGEIPSTTFVERLVKGIADSGSSVILFGAQRAKVRYSTSINVVSYKHTHLSKFLHLLCYSILLILFRPKDKKRLDSYLKAQQLTDLYSKVKYYPVLWYQPDVFHVQWAKGLNDWVWVKKFGIKLVLSLRGAHINYSPIADSDLAEMYNTYFPKVDAFHAVSKAIGKAAEIYGAPKEKITLVYSGLPLESEKLIEKKPNKVFQIVSVGRSHWKKGYTYALDACKLLKDSGLNFHYTIVGGANTIEFAYQVNDLKLTNQVTLVDQLPYDKVQNLMAHSDLLLLPSVEEGIANVVLEAMLNHTLVLTTDCGGMPEVIADNVNGFMVPIRNVEQMAKKILMISKLTPSENLRIQNNAYQTIIEKHSEKQMVDAMMHLYQGL